MKKKYLSLFLIPLTLVSCGNDLPLEFYPYTDITDVESPKKYEKNDTYYRFTEYNSLEYYKNSEEKESINNYRDVYSSDNSSNVYLNQSSLGDQKILVIPVSFKDSSRTWTNEKIINLKNAFFGDPNKIGFESVSSFYNKSSYGQLRISGEIAPIYTCEYKLTDNLDEYSKITKMIASSAVEYLRENSLINLFDYDLDHDEYIDSVYLVYDAPFNATNSDSIFWAFTNHTKKGEFGLNNESPYVCSHSWSSVDFAMQEENLAYRNTFIHEVGHLFGLEDYYSNISSYQPTGSFDVMDSNLGDQTAYSKMILDWVTPYVITGEGKITLRSFSKTGDLALVPIGDYNGTPYDEYLLLEYFTGDGLNETNNASYQYETFTHEKGIFTFPTYHGVKVYHVDSRLAYLIKKNMGGTSNAIYAYFDDKDVQTKLDEITTTYCIGIGNTNQVLSNSTPVLYHLLEKDGNNTFFNGKAASNNTLFRLNDSFGFDTYSNFKGNKKDFWGYRCEPYFNFKITELHNDNVTIEFSYK